MSREKGKESGIIWIADLDEGIENRKMEEIKVTI